MPRVDQVKLDLGQVALVGVSAVGRKDLVVLAPDDERRRLVLKRLALPPGRALATRPRLTGSSVTGSCTAQ